MASKSSNYHLFSVATKTTVEPNVAYLSSSSSPASCASSEFSSAYISPNLTPTHENDDFWKKSPSQFDSLDLSNIRVKMPPMDPWSCMAAATECGNASKMNFTNNLNDNFVVKNESSALENYSFLLSTLGEITYAPLSSFYDTVNDGSQISAYNERLQYEVIRKEFEMNGTTSDVLPPFEPAATSTPSFDRKVQKSSEGFSSVEESFDLEWSCNNFQAAFSKRQGFEARYQKFDFKSSRVLPTNVPNQKRAKKPSKKSLGNFCVFCKNNGAEPSLYNSHTVEDSQGRCLCPMLRQYKCPICKLDGDRAHTTKYCPKRKIFTEEDMHQADLRGKRKSALKF